MAKEGDFIDRILAIGCLFDWITPVANEVQGYNQLRYEGDYTSCLVIRDQLRARGEQARVEGNFLSGYRVVTKG